MIGFNQSIDDKTYKKAILIHYFSYKYTYINLIIGGVTLLIVISLSFLFGELQKQLIILGLIGLYLLVKPYLYVENVFKSIKTKDLGTDITKVMFTDKEQIVVNIGENSSTVSLKDLYAFHNHNFFLFLYIARNQYFLIEKNNLTKEELNSIIKNLKTLKIKEK